MTNHHPFFQPLEELTIEELEKKHSDLMNRWRIAKMTNMDQNVAHQLDLMLNNIEDEKERRQIADDKPNGVILDTDPIKNLPNIPVGNDIIKK